VNHHTVRSLALVALIGAVGCHHATPAAPATPAPDAPLILNPRGGVPALTVVGLVVADSAGGPPVQAIVELTDLQRRTLPNAVGAFELKEVPSGEHQLVVHALNYAPLFARIVVPYGYLGSTIRIVLATSPSCLDYCDLPPQRGKSRVENLP
jgi:hypothetical protein